MTEQEKQKLLEDLVTIRSEGLTIRKKLLALPGDSLLVLTDCLAKLEAFDAAITVEIDTLRYHDTTLREQP
jgi:hypothetical protein